MSADETVAVVAATHLLEERWGLDARALGEGSLARAVRARVASSGLDPSAWAALLTSRTTEADALIEAVIVPETMLFRDGSAFGALGEIAGARLMDASAERPVRVLSAACSTGEEAFSIAIALLAHGLPAEAIRVVAVDVSARAIAAARSGRCSSSALRGHIPGWAERWLTRVPGGVVIAPEVLATIDFRVGNLMDPLPAGPWDAVLCRNVLVYLVPAARARLLERIRAHLAPGAPLFVGHAEVAALLDLGWRHQRRYGPWALEPVPVSAPPAERPAGRRTGTPAPAARSSIVVAPPRAPAPAPRAAAAASVGSAPAAPLPARLDEAVALAESGERERAIALLEEVVRVDRENVAAHALLGVLHATGGDETAARNALRRALYLDPGHAESRAQLALLDRPRSRGR